jgi:pimeloyl-ACP methyl ester carboxylesterase
VVPAGVPGVAVDLPYSVVGELCATSAELRAGATVQLLIHGGTYNHTYWDFGTHNGVRYSYARNIADAGIATFAVDQIGTGQSVKPPSSEVTNEVAAYVDHDVVQALRAGTLAGTHFDKVIEVGHSAGSAATWQEAITYQDVDGVVITGTVHHLSASAGQVIGQDFYPAGADPKFQDQPWATTDPITSPRSLAAGVQPLTTRPTRILT